MAWTVEITPEARAVLKEIGDADSKRILKFLDQRIEGRDNPRNTGKPLKGNLREYWRYRVGDYRLFCRLEDDIVTVFVVHVGHRNKVYK